MASYLKALEQAIVMEKIEEYYDNKQGKIEFDSEEVKSYYFWHYGLQSFPQEYIGVTPYTHQLEIRVHDDDGYHSHYGVRTVLIDFEEMIPVAAKPREYRNKGTSSFAYHIDFDKEGKLKEKPMNHADEVLGEKLEENVKLIIERNKKIREIEKVISYSKNDLKAALPDELFKIVEEVKKGASDSNAIKKIEL